MTKNLQRERTTLSAVASLAGVSTSTVSLVLSGKSEQRRIPPETRDRVRRAAEELNYAPNLLTRSLRRGRTHVISFFSTFRRREWGDLYMDRITSAVETVAGDAGYDVLAQCNYRRSVKEVYQFINGGMVDGLLLLAPTPDDPLLEMLRRSPLPVVIVNGEDPQKRYSSVSDDVKSGQDQVAEQLLAHGHTRIAAMGSIGEVVRDSEVRLRLLRESLRRRGTDLQTEQLASTSKSPAVRLRELLDQPHPPTAIFCWHDRFAYEILEACEEFGVRVPDQLSVIGYDGIQWPSKTRHVCASVDVDLQKVASMAVDLLDRSIADPAAPVLHQLVPVGFSTGTTLSTPCLTTAMEHI